MSIRPQHVANILNGIKTIEIRKKFPKDYVGWVYIYCTKDKKYANLINRGGFLTGMVVARFWCDRVVDFFCYTNNLLKQVCLTEGELLDYLGSKNGCAIYISRVEIFDKPKEIGEFKPHYGYPTNHRLNRAPQSWCYVIAE